MFAILLIENVVRTFLNIDLVDSFVQYLNDVFSLKPDNPVFLPDNPIDSSNDDAIKQHSVVVQPSSEDTVQPAQSIDVDTRVPENDGNEVFNISGNYFTYEDAPAVCAAYGAELATYDQIEDSYNNGGEWCNYGWSAEQMAFFPTQKDTWKKIQANPSTANSCGRPGVNGGYMPDPNLTFGVNCYGKKPAITQNDKLAMKEHQQLLNQPTQPTPLTPEEVEFQQKLQYWQQNAAQLLTINGFNENKWSQY